MGFSPSPWESPSSVGGNAAVLFSKGPTSLLFGHGGEAEPVGSAACGPSAGACAGAPASACRTGPRALAPRPLPTNAQRNRGLGSGSTAGILAAIPQSTIARSHPDRTAQACAPRPQCARAACLGGRGGGAGPAASWPCHAEGTGCRDSLRDRARGVALSQGRRRRERRPALCV